MSQIGVLLCGILASASLAAAPEGPAIHEAAKVAFSTPPTITRRGDEVTIAFTVDTYGDATVAIEGPDHAIVRHLASGVLGANAPAPFAKNSRSQSVVWDGKRDDGMYIDDTDALTVRVYLGLTARFEKALLWSPYKRLDDVSASIEPPLICAAPEGVYVCDGGDTHHVRLYSHEGTYVRTIYPFAASRIRGVRGLMWHTCPDDPTEFPLKHGASQATLLTSGDLRHGREWPSAGEGSAVSAMVARDGRLLLARQRLDRLQTTGDSGGPALSGPQTCIEYAGPGGKDVKCPRSAALSPDGQWLYLAGFSPTTPYWDRGYLHAVMRLDPAGEAPPELFAGAVTTDGGDGTDNARFNIPASVACDRSGRVYVADYLNDRLQVFGADGRFLTTIRTKRPSQVRIHPATGEMYVFSWFFFNPRETPPARAVAHLTRFEPLPAEVRDPAAAPRTLAQHDLADLASAYGRVAEADVDFWTEPPTIWFSVNRCTVDRARLDGGARDFILEVSAREEDRAIQLLQERPDGLVTVKRLDRLVPPELSRFDPGSRIPLSVDPKTGDLYAGGGAEGFSTCLRISPGGALRTVQLPFQAFDMAFYPEGYVCLRSMHNRLGNVVVRYDPGQWTEIPFDYGVEAPEGLRGVMSAAVAPGPTVHPLRGGMGVSPLGRLAIAWTRVQESPDGGQRGGRRSADRNASDPRAYPGRVGLDCDAQMVRVWDVRGKVLFEDALPGIDEAPHLAMDKKDNLFAILDAVRLQDNRPGFNSRAGTLVKAPAGRARFVSDDPLAPIPLTETTRPRRPPDLGGPPLGPAWLEGAEWLFGGCGLKCGRGGQRSGFALDLYGRCFVPRTDRYDLAVLDPNGNLMARIGQYGNADDAPGGDGVALFHPTDAAVHTDRRLFIADPGNARVVSAALSYRATQTVSLRPGPNVAAPVGSVEKYQAK